MKRELDAIERILTGKKSTAAAAARELTETVAGRSLLAVTAQALGVPVRLIRDGAIAGDGVLLPGPGGVRFGRIVPGHYTLVMSTGRVLWERQLVAEELLTAFSLPETALRAAAQTKEFEPDPTITTALAGGALMVRVFAGREAGTIECVMKRKPRR